MDDVTLDKKKVNPLVLSVCTYIQTYVGMHIRTHTSFLLSLCKKCTFQNGHSDTQKTDELSWLFCIQYYILSVTESNFLGSNFLPFLRPPFLSPSP